MPDIYATNDGRAIHYSTSSWADARGNQPANSVSDLSLNSTIQVQKSAGRGGTTYGVSRAFFTFDTSSITSTPDSAVLKIYGYSTNGADVIAVKSDYSSSLATSDFDNIVNAATPLGSSDGSGAGTFAGTSVVEYSSELASWSTSGYNSITLNSDALSDIESLSTFKVCLIEYDHDYLDIEPSGILRTGAHFSSYSGTSKDPYIEVTGGTGTTIVYNSTFFGSNF